MTIDRFSRSSDYERAGIAWWNSMSERERARWLKVANTCVIAEAYACYCALMDAFNGADDEVAVIARDAENNLDRFDPAFEAFFDEDYEGRFHA